MAAVVAVMMDVALVVALMVAVVTLALEVMVLVGAQTIVAKTRNVKAVKVAAMVEMIIVGLLGGLDIGWGGWRC